VDLSDREDIKQAVGQAIVDYMVARVKGGEGIGGVSLSVPKYSPEYINSDAFKAFGKSEFPINMTLTGSMLEAMTVIDSNDNDIVIGWEDTTENAKAYNHNIGDTVPKRPFFGVSNSELDKIKSELKGEVRAILKEGIKKQEANDIILGKIASFIKDVL